MPQLAFISIDYFGALYLIFWLAIAWLIVRWMLQMLKLKKEGNELLREIIDRLDQKQ